MKLSAPTQLVFMLSVLLIVLATASTFVAIPIASTFSFEMALFAYLVLMAGNLLEGL